MIKPEQAITIGFETQRFDSGAATDADSLPTGVLVKNGSDTAATVTVTNKADGSYTASVTIPVDATAGDVFEIRIEATVNSVAGKATIWRDDVDTVRLSDKPNVKVDWSADVSNPPTISSLTAQQVWEYATRSLPSTEREAIRDAILNRVLSGNYDAANTVGKLLQFLDAAITSRMATFTYTAPDNESIAAAKVIADKLNTMLQTDGSVSQFTANALENGPAGSGGGSATLENQQMILVKLLEILQLMGLAPGANVPVHSGPYYCLASDLDRTFGAENITEWADVAGTGDATEIANRKTDAIASAYAEINSILRASHYRIPLKTSTGAVPDEIRDIAAKLAGVDLYERKASRNMDDDGQSGAGIRGHRQEALAILAKITTGERRINAMY
jgi:hypothetical protein